MMKNVEDRRFIHYLIYLYPRRLQLSSFNYPTTSTTTFVIPSIALFRPHYHLV
ncbi:hypothetical protein BGW80DRAFT_655581 [Lactifluus volemus]|nr:hypothetical protein BGW80DRAFT_655581 [Lactifluus volemus]